MKTFLPTLASFCKKTLDRLRGLFMRLSTRMKVVTTLIFVLAIAAALSFLSDDTSKELITNSARSVTLRSVSELSSAAQSFSFVGTVSPLSEAVLKAESGGRVTQVSASLGQKVSPGQILIIFENSAERAALLQAEGAFEAAKAAWSISGLNKNQAAKSLADAKEQAVTSILSAYNTMDDVIRGKTDTAYADPRFASVSFLPSVPDASLVNSLETKRRVIEPMLLKRAQKNLNLEASPDLIGELDLISEELSYVKNYLDDLASAYSKALPTQTYPESSLAGFRATVNAARQSVLSLLTATVASKTTLSASLTAESVAKLNYADQSSAELAASNGQVKQAEGAYLAAKARYEKTIVRSPLYGTVNALSVKVGDYITPFTDVAVVSGNGALEVKAFVTEVEARLLSVGTVVSLGNGVRGSVTSIAQSLDPRTKKIEVRVGLLEGAVKSVQSGSTVRFSVDQMASSTYTGTQDGISVPLASVKLTPNGALVFVIKEIDGSATLEGVEVKLGKVRGQRIEIVEGIEPSTMIITDARGLKSGDFVTVKK